MAAGTERRRLGDVPSGLAGAAEARDWAVRWFDAKTIFDAAEASLPVHDFDAFSARVRSAVGPPWSEDHKLAMAAAIVARGSRRETPRR